MKRKWLIGLLSVFMVLAMCFGVVACGGDTEQDEETAQTVINQLNSLYQKANKDTPDDFQRLAQVKIEDTTYPVEWSADVKTEGYDNCVKVGTEKNASGMITIDVTRVTVDVEYTLTATVKVNEVTKSASYEHKIPKKSAEGTETATLSFATDAARVSQSAAQQVWASNGITLTNDKGSGSDIIDSKDPVRFYKNSIIKIEYPGLIRVDFHCSIKYSNDNYASSLKTSLEAAYPNAKSIEADDTTGITTFELNSPVDSIEFQLTKSKIFMDSIDVEGFAGGLTDAQKVAAAKASVKLAQNLFFEENTVNMMTESNGASIAWSIKETTTYASVVEGRQLKVTTLPAEETKLTLVASISSGSEKDTAEFEITLKPKPALEHAGTQENPFSAADAITIANLLPSGGYYMKDGENAKIYVKGYIIAGAWNTQYGNFDGMYIADSLTATTDSPDKVQVFGLKTDNQFITEQGTLPVGMTITVLGGLQNFRDTAEVSLQPVTVALTDERSPEMQLDAALATLKNMTVGKIGDVSLAASFGNVEFTWAVKSGETLPDGVTFANNKLTVETLPEESTPVVFEVTGHIDDATDKKVEITVTFVPQSSTPAEGDLVLTTENLFAGLTKQNNYAVFDGVHTVGSTTVTTSKVMISTSDDYPDTLQFQKTNGTITLSGTFTQIVIIVDTSFALVNPTVTVGTTSIIGTADAGEVQGKTSTNYDITRYTIVYDINVAGEQTVTIKTANSAGAMYVPSITFSGTASGGTVTPPGPGGETEGKTFNPLTSPEAGDYIMGMDVEGQMYYLKGGMSGFYLATSTNVAEAKTVKLQSTEGGWLLVCDDQYIEIEKSGTHINAVYKKSPTAGKVWKWNAEHSVFVITLDDGDYYLGTYWKSDLDYPYNTIGGSKLDEWSETKQYHAFLGTYGNSTQGGGDDGGDENQADKNIAAAKAAILAGQINLETEYSATNGAGVDLPTENNGATLAWAIKNAQDVIAQVKIEDGKLIIVALPQDADLKVTLVATISCEGASKSDTAEVVITIKKAASTGPVEPSGSTLTLTTSLFGDVSGSYDAFNGEYTYAESYTVATTQVMKQTFGTESVLQFQAEKGVLSIAGTFTKVELTYLSTYQYESMNKPEVNYGGTVLTAKADSSDVDTGEKDGDGASAKTIYRHVESYAISDSTGVKLLKVDYTKQKGTLRLSQIVITTTEGAAGHIHTCGNPTQKEPADNVYHTVSCSCGYTKDEAHVYSGDDDTLCDKCNYERTIDNSVWTRVDNVETLTEGAKIVLIYSDDKVTAVNGGISGKYLSAINQDVTLSDEGKTAKLPATAQELTLGKDGGNWTLAIGDDVLGLSGSSNNSMYLSSVAQKNSLNITTTWTIVIEDGVTKITSTVLNTCRLQYNSTANQERFSNYKTATQKDPTIYIKSTPSA